MRFVLQVPNLTDSWNDVRDKFNVATDEFKTLILEQHAKKKSEYDEWQGVVQVSVCTGRA